MAREISRVNPQFLQEQKNRRDTLASTPGNSGNSVPELRDRLTVVEEIVSIRQPGT